MLVAGGGDAVASANLVQALPPRAAARTSRYGGSRRDPAAIAAEAAAAAAANAPADLSPLGPGSVTDGEADEDVAAVASGLAARRVEEESWAAAAEAIDAAAPRAVALLAARASLLRLEAALTSATASLHSPALGVRAGGAWFAADGDAVRAREVWRDSIRMAVSPQPLAEAALSLEAAVYAVQRARQLEAGGKRALDRAVDNHARRKIPHARDQRGGSDQQPTVEDNADLQVGDAEVAVDDAVQRDDDTAGSHVPAGWSDGEGSSNAALEEDVVRAAENGAAGEADDLAVTGMLWPSRAHRRWWRARTRGGGGSIAAVSLAVLELHDAAAHAQLCQPPAVLGYSDTESSDASGDSSDEMSKDDRTRSRGVPRKASRLVRAAAAGGRSKLRNARAGGDAVRSISSDSSDSDDSQSAETDRSNSNGRRPGRGKIAQTRQNAAACTRVAPAVTKHSYKRLRRGAGSAAVIDSESDSEVVRPSRPVGRQTRASRAAETWDRRDEIDAVVKRRRVGRAAAKHAGDDVSTDTEMDARRAHVRKPARSRRAVADGASSDSASEEDGSDSASGSADTHDSVCGECHDADGPGALLMCEACTAVAHVTCAGLRKVPKGDWFCRSCAEEKCPACSVGPVRPEASVVCGAENGVGALAGCSRPFHRTCVGLATLPESDWYCTECAARIGTSNK